VKRDTIITMVQVMAVLGPAGMVKMYFHVPRNQCAVHDQLGLAEVRPFGTVPPARRQNIETRACVQAKGTIIEKLVVPQFLNDGLRD